MILLQVCGYFLTLINLMVFLMFFFLRLKILIKLLKIQAYFLNKVLKFSSKIINEIFNPLQIQLIFLSI